MAILAGMAIFPIVFANGLEPDSGPGLIFQTLPIAFGEMPFGALFGALFFVLLVFAAWTSGISLLEPITAWLVENRSLSRVRAAMLGGVTVWLLGIACLLSLNVWSDVTMLSLIQAIPGLGALDFWTHLTFLDKGFLDFFDFLTANVMLPLGGLLIAVFAGWVLSRASSVDELDLGQGVAYRLWRFLIRYLAPLAVLLVFLKAVGALQWIGLG